MSHELSQILKSVENILNSRHGIFYAGLAAITAFSLGYLCIDNKRGLSVTQDGVAIQVGESSEQPQE